MNLVGFTIEIVLANSVSTRTFTLFCFQYMFHTAESCYTEQVQFNAGSLRTGIKAQQFYFYSSNCE